MTNFNVPVDEDGNPLAIVSFAVEEKIGLPNYSNVTVGPATVIRFVKDTPEARAEGLRDCAAETEGILHEERKPVLELIRGQE